MVLMDSMTNKWRLELGRTRELDAKLHEIVQERRVVDWRFGLCNDLLSYRVLTRLEGASVAFFMRCTTTLSANRK